MIRRFLKDTLNLTIILGLAFFGLPFINALIENY